MWTRSAAALISLHEDDTCVICGDFCWAMRSCRGAAGFSTPQQSARQKADGEGQSRLLVDDRGKMNAFLCKTVWTPSLCCIITLRNGENLALCGTRGWFKDEETGTEHDAKVLRREVGRLETSLKCAGEREKLVFLHYPPLYLHYTCPEILHVLSGIRRA